MRLDAKKERGHLLAREAFKDQSTLELGLEMCTGVLQATYYDRVARDGDGSKRSWGKYRWFWLPIVKCQSNNYAKWCHWRARQEYAQEGLLPITEQTLFSAHGRFLIRGETNAGM